MSFPPLLLGAALAFWGWQCELLALGVALGLLLEAPRLAPMRLELSAAREERVADFCSVAYLCVLAAAVAMRGATSGVLLSLEWLPVLVYPVVAAQALSARPVRLTSLFYLLRRQKARDPEVARASVDVRAPYLALVAIAAGVERSAEASYFPGLVVLAGWALVWQRPRPFTALGSAALVGLAAGAGYALQLGLADLQSRLEEWASEFFIRAADDPYRSRTEIGSIGRLKQTDAVLLRVHAPLSAAPAVRLLRAASFNTFVDSAWVARQAPLAPLVPEADGVSWRLAAGDAAAETMITLRAASSRALLALPHGATQVGVTAASLSRNRLGSTLADVLPGWVRYRVGHAPGVSADDPPDALDYDVPPKELAALQQVVGELGLRELAPADAVRRVHEHLQGFTYSLWRERAPSGSTAIADFLLRTRSGHCEYFAAAAALLLRAAGIPARYATGFAAIEHSALEGAFLVRARHAHAWTRVHLDGRWLDLDATPPSWVEMEEAQAPAWQAALDLARWIAFRMATAGEAEARLAALAAGLAVALFLAWRLRAWKRLFERKRQRAAAGGERRSGLDSEFFAVQAEIARRFGARATSEALPHWIERVTGSLDAALRGRIGTALALHHRYRFDPAGVTPAERQALRAASETLTRELSSAQPG